MDQQQNAANSATEQPLPEQPQKPARAGRIKGAGVLTDATLRALKPLRKPYKRGDGHGLYVYVTPQGGKSFRWDFRYQGRRQTLTYGLYPDWQLKKVRKSHETARQWLADGKDPITEWETARASIVPLLGFTLQEIGEQCFPPAVEGAPKREMRDGKLRQVQGATERRRLEMYIYPKLGSIDIRAVTKEQLWEQLAKILSQKKQELARRVKMHCRVVWQRAVADKKCQHNIVNDLEHIPRPKKRDRRHHAAIKDPRRFGKLLCAIYCYSESDRAELSTKYAWKIAPHIVLRSSELRWMRWTWVNFDTQEIRIPEEIMKRPEPHIILMSKQVAQYFRELYEYTRDSEYCFPSLRTARPLSENALNVALRTMGIPKEEHTCHGNRTFFSTQLRENGWPRDPVEIQLAHALDAEDETEAAYNHAEYLPLRRIMLQWWSDYLDSLRLNKTKPKIPYKEVQIALAKQSFMYNPSAMAA